jgi:(R,R)-butanediol dehydrogenase / meso-butanediol dehydrogenase / diacetyl reductase
MQAALWYARHDIRVEDMLEPKPGPNDVLLKVDWCGICGTDMGEYLYGPLLIPIDQPHPLTGMKAPIVMGHEFGGEVIEVGRNVTHLKIGDKVGVDTIISCGVCYWCKRHEYVLCPSLGALGFHAHGGLAEYCVAPAYMCLPLPAGLPLEEAPLVETLSVVVRALRKGRLKVGESVAIIGAGAVGLMAVQLARASGAGAIYVVEMAEIRKQQALALGAEAVFDPTRVDVRAEILSRTRGVGVDLALECAGHHEAVILTIEVARRGGRAVLIGIPKKESHYNFTNVVMTEKEIIGSLSHIYDEDYAAAIRLMGDGRIKAGPVISHRIALADIVKNGFERLATSQADVLKIIVSPSGIFNV